MQSWMRWSAAALCLGLVGGLYLFVEHSIGWQQLTQEDALRSYFASYGIWAPLFYIAMLSVAVVVSQLPNIPLVIAAGMAFGPLWGGIYSLLGGLIGASIDFWIGRTLGRATVKLLMGKTLTFCDRCTDSYIGRIILITRLLPLFSFDIISYGAGLTTISYRAFFLVTLIGMAPMTFLFTTLGEVVHINSSLMIGLTLLVVVGLFLIPTAIRRYNWFDLRDRIKME